MPESSHWRLAAVVALVVLLSCLGVECDGELSAEASR
jgi:hypothetical protein